MHRLFLDANVLFSAAYRAESPLLRLWDLPATELITSLFAFNEAARNAASNEQRIRTQDLVGRMTLWIDGPTGGRLFLDIDLPEKDLPILIAAIDSGATHLLTGDRKHFGPFFGDSVEGVWIGTPRRYLDHQANTPRGQHGG